MDSDGRMFSHTSYKSCNAWSSEVVQAHTQCNTYVQRRFDSHRLVVYLTPNQSYLWSNQTHLYDLSADCYAWSSDSSPLSDDMVASLFAEGMNPYQHDARCSHSGQWSSIYRSHLVPPPGPQQSCHRVPTLFFLEHVFPHQPAHTGPLG